MSVMRNVCLVLVLGLGACSSEVVADSEVVAEAAVEKPMPTREKLASPLCYGKDAPASKCFVKPEPQEVANACKRVGNKVACNDGTVVALPWLATLVLN